MSDLSKWSLNPLPCDSFVGFTTCNVHKNVPQLSFIDFTIYLSQL
jgi:hypothetical protein